MVALANRGFFGSCVLYLRMGMDGGVPVGKGTGTPGHSGLWVRGATPRVFIIVG